MEIGICSYSFHRLLRAGKQDILRYISDCKELGCTQLDPWNAHLTATGDDDLAKIEEAADVSGLPWGLLAVDGAHIYEATEEARAEKQAARYHWLDVAGKLGFEQIRIDCGGPEEMSDEVFDVIVEGYNDVIARARPMGVQVLIENHLGPSKIPANVVKLCESIEGLGLLYDTNNWREDLREEGRRTCAKFAAACHVKTFEFDATGNETSGANPEEAIGMLLDSGYKGVWGVESVPKDGDEYAAARKTIDLIRRTVA